MSLRVAFLGTAAFAAPALKAVAEAGHTLCLVASQPDRPRGRGHELRPTPLKEAALALGLEVFQPDRIKDPAALARVAEAAPDVLAVVAYGQILPQALLDIPRLGAVNLHASLLPRWRGAAPVEWAVAEGDAETGVCTQRMALRLDAGDVLLSRATPIGPDEDADAVAARLMPMGAELLAATLAGLEAQTLAGAPQNEMLATHARLLTRADAEADFTQDAEVVARRCRAFHARIGFHARLEGSQEALKLHRLVPDTAPAGAAPGEVLKDAQGGLRVACGRGSVRVERLQPAGGRPMDAAEFLRGRRVAPGSRFAAHPL